MSQYTEDLERIEKEIFYLHEKGLLTKTVDYVNYRKFRIEAKENPCCWHSPLYLTRYYRASILEKIKDKLAFFCFTEPKAGVLSLVFQLNDSIDVDLRLLTLKNGGKLCLTYYTSFTGYGEHADLNPIINFLKTYKEDEDSDILEEKTPNIGFANSGR